MLTDARINDELRPAQLDWISALRAPQIKALVNEGALQLSLFDEQDLVEISSPEFPASGWCAATTPCWPRSGPANAASCWPPPKKSSPPSRPHRPRQTPAARPGQDRAAGGQGDQPHNMAKHFTLEITDESFTFTRNTEAIAAEAALDGIYVLRTSLPTDTLTESEVVARYKNLADVERFFRTLNTELDIRPIRHRLADRVRAHVFLRMLSYYISWHMKAALAPILFVDNDKPAAAAKRANPVAAAQRSDAALKKAARKRTAEDTPVHSFTSLLADLATLCANQIQPNDDMPAFTMTTCPTPLQRRAFELLDLSHRHGYA